MSRLRSEASSYDEVMEGADEARPPWRLDRAAMAVCTELEELRDGRTTPEYGVPRLRRRHDELRALITATPGEYRFSRDVETIARFILDGDGPREDGK